MENPKPTETKQPVEKPAENEGRTTAIIAYITLIGLIVAFVLNNDKKDPFAAYHIKQSLGLGLTGLALSVVNIIPILGWIVSFLGFFVIIYMWIVSLLNAVNNKQKPAPILGKKYEEWFKTL